MSAWSDDMISQHRSLITNYFTDFAAPEGQCSTRQIEVIFVKLLLKGSNDDNRAYVSKSCFKDSLPDRYVCHFSLSRRPVSLGNGCTFNSAGKGYRISRRKNHFTVSGSPSDSLKNVSSAEDPQGGYAGKGYTPTISDEIIQML